MQQHPSLEFSLELARNFGKSCGVTMVAPELTEFKTPFMFGSDTLVFSIHTHLETVRFALHAGFIGRLPGDTTMMLWVDYSTTQFLWRGPEDADRCVWTVTPHELHGIASAMYTSLGIDGEEYHA